MDANRISTLRTDVCCLCAEEPIIASIYIENESFQFCETCRLRATFLQRGQACDWPALETRQYSIDNTAHGWVMTAILGTNERMVELLDALDEYEANQPKAS